MAFAGDAGSAGRAPLVPQLGECEGKLYFLLQTMESLVWKHSITGSAETSLIVLISVGGKSEPCSVHRSGAVLGGFVFWFTEGLGKLFLGPGGLKQCPVPKNGPTPAARNQVRPKCWTINTSPTGASLLLPPAPTDSTAASCLPVLALPCLLTRKWPNDSFWGVRK